MLAALAMQNASGALRIAGDPSGVIYLDAGHITFAQTDWVPDLAARLRELPDVPSAARALLMAGDDPDRDPGALLVESKCLSKAALRAVLRSMIIDAMIVLTLPLADETSIISTRFETPAFHWAAQYSRLGIDTALAQAEKKLAGLLKTRLSLTGPLELADLTGGRAVLKREHWQVASRINGQTSVRELAWECGLSLTETIDCVSYLIRKGMCAPGPPELKSGPQMPEQAEPAAGEVAGSDFAKGQQGSSSDRTPRPSGGTKPARSAGAVGPRTARPASSNGSAIAHSAGSNGSAVTRSAGPGSASPRSAGARRTGTRPAGASSAGASSAGASSAGASSAGASPAESDSAGRAGVIPAGPVR